MTEIQAWIVLFGTILSIALPFASAFAASVYKTLITHLPSAKYALVLGYAKTVTSGIEQLMGKGGISKDPSTRKAAAMSAIKAILKDHGLAVPDVLISFAIEEAVATLAPSGLSGNSTPVPVLVSEAPVLANDPLGTASAAAMTPAPAMAA